MQLYLSLLITLSMFVVAASARGEECSKRSHWTTYSYIRAAAKERVYFYSEPKACSKAPCSQRRKAYLVNKDFVTLAESRGNFVCADLRGKSETVGWLLKKKIDPPRAGSFHRQDLTGTWWQIPCGAGDDCMLDLTVPEKGPIDVSLMAHLHEHPGEQFHVKNIEESSGAIFVNGELKIIFHDPALPPGMIRIEEDNQWYSGLYYKDRQK